MGTNIDTTGFNYDFHNIRGGFRGERAGDFKKEILFEYLYDIQGRFNKEGGVFVFVPRIHDVTNGVMALLGRGEFHDNAVKYILSSDRSYSPTHVSCSDKNYKLIDSILKRERGDSAHLSRGVDGWISNTRSINF